MGPAIYPKSPQKPAAFKSVEVLLMGLSQSACTHRPPPRPPLIVIHRNAVLWEKNSCCSGPLLPTPKTAATQGLSDRPATGQQGWFCGLR